jgi:multiple sugar transport system substrate-binding protein
MTIDHLNPQSKFQPTNLTAYLMIFLAMGVISLLAACQRTPTPTSPAASLTPTQAPHPTSLPAPTPTPTPEPTITLDVDPQDLQGLKIQLWHPWVGGVNATLQALVRAFNAENSNGFTVEAVSLGSYNELYSRVDSALQDGTLPHLVVGYNYALQSWDSPEGRLVDLDAYVNDQQWGIPLEEQADYYPLIWEQDAIEGVRLGLPAQRFAQLMYYNQTWARQLGFSKAPQTPGEFRRQACAAALANNSDNDPDNNGTGGWVVDTDPPVVLSWIYAFGSDVVQPSGSGYRFNTPENHALLEFLRRLYEDGCAWQMLSSYPEEHFAARRALFTSGSIVDSPYIAAALERVDNPDDWTVIGFPNEQRMPVIDVYGPAYGMFSSSPEQQLATWIFLQWLLEPTNQARFIQASGSLPLRAATTDTLQDYATGHPQWQAAVDLLPNAQGEPVFPSWSVVRWAVGDVGSQIFKSYFTTDYITDTLTLLDQTAAELHKISP